MKVYLSGPMTGIPEHNFPAFHEAASLWRAAGHTVVSPAEMDKTDDHEALAKVPWTTYLRRDLSELLTCEGIVCLPGWQQSRGAVLEVHVARALEMHVLAADSPLYPKSPDESALEEAQRLVHGARGDAYGHPADDFARTGRIWGAIIGIPDVAPEWSASVWPA